MKDTTMSFIASQHLSRDSVLVQLRRLITKMFRVTLVVLFVGSFFVPLRSQDVSGLKYPSRPFLEVLVSKPQVDTKGLEDLRYPNDSLLSSILSKVSGVLSNFMVS